jgi:FemAB-related protein (PEP-CTERM system-associated)
VTSAAAPAAPDARPDRGPRAIDVVVCGDADRGAWDRYVSSRPEATAYHDWRWREVIAATFGHECLYLAARDDGRIAGVLPLVAISSRIFGRSMTSMPFLNYGGVLADAPAAGRALLEAAADEARRRRCDHVELRHISRQFDDLPCRQHKVTMRLALAPDMWPRVDRKVRNQVRKAEKSDLTAVRGGVELVREFYTVFARNMRDLGTPVYSIRLFEAVLATFADRARLIVVRLGDRPVAAGLTFRTGDLIEIPWASSIRDYNSRCPNHLLYWTAIDTAVAEGCTTFDFGRSTPGEGTYKFKEQWGAVPVALHWEYVLLAGAAVPDTSPANPKYRLAIAAWKRLPVEVATAIGPHLVRSIP